MNLRLLFFKQPNQFVVLLNRLQRLDIDGLPAGTSSMNDTRNAPLRLRLDRNHEAFPTNRDQLVLNAATLRQPPQRLAQTLLDLPLLALDLAPDAIQVRRGVVGERTVRQHPRAKRLD